MKSIKFISTIAIMSLLVSCGNTVTLKSVGTIDLDSMLVDVEPLIVLTVYQNELLPEKYADIQSEIADEYADNFNAYNWLIGDYADGLFQVDQDNYEDAVAEATKKAYDTAWEEIQYIVNNNISESNFPMSDINDKYVSEFIEYYFQTIGNVEAKIALSKPILVKDEEEYATFTVTNTLSTSNYLIKLTNQNDSTYNIEVSEL